MNQLKILMMSASIFFAANSQAEVTTMPVKDTAQIKVGVQLWSVRDKIAQDFKGTLESLANMGFQAVEFAGVFGEFANNPSELKLYLKSLGLVASGAHVSFEQLTDDNVDETLNFYRELGAKYLIIGWDERAWHPMKFNDFMADLNHAYPIVKAAGFEFGFHNHDQEFNAFRQSTYWDNIANNSNPNMVLQLDVGWVNYAGKDPIHYVKAYQGRTLTTHYKVRTQENENKSSILGKDGYNWNALFNVMKDFGGTKWVIVEQEEYPDGLTSLQAVAASKAGLDKLLAR